MEKIRPITITVASIAFIIFGLVTIVYAVLLGIALSSVTTLSAAGALAAGGLIFLVAVLGILHIVAGYGLWYMKRWASIMGMLLGIFGLIFQTFSYYLVLGVIPYTTYPSTLSLSFAGAGSPWVDILLVILIAISAKSFEPTAT